MGEESDVGRRATDALERERRAMPNVEIAASSGTLPAYLAYPGGAGPWPGVVVIHDAYGAGDNLVRHAEWLAASGFIAIAPDLLHWSKKFTCLRAVMRDIASRRGRSFDDLEATRLWLRDRPDCTGRIGVIGFCMGGAFAMLLAPGGGYAAAAPNYGAVPKDADTYFKGSCPIIGSFGGRDPVLPRAAQKLERALALNNVEHDVKRYERASHGFMDDHSQDHLPLPLVIVKKILNVGYDELAADDAKGRIKLFFDRKRQLIPALS